MINSINLGNLLDNILGTPEVDLDSLFEKYRANARQPRATHADGTVVPAIRSEKDEKGCTVYVDIPGVKKDTIDASINDKTRVLSVKASRVDGTATYSGTISIDRSYDLKRASTSYEDGVLKVSIPRYPKDSAENGVRKLAIR